MTWEEQYKEFQAMMSEMDELLKNKGREYAGKDDALANFKAADQFGITPLQKLGTFMDKHVRSVYSYIANNGKVFSNEPIEGRINDIANYCFLLRCLIKDMEKEKLQNKQQDEAKIS